MRPGRQGHARRRGARLAATAGGGTFASDRAAEAPISDAALRAVADAPGQELTYTCVPPGSGARIGIDRDEDGFLDGDEGGAAGDCPPEPATGCRTAGATASSS